MSTRRLSALLHQVHRLLRSRQHPESDASVLDRFVQQRDEQAFAILMNRYGPLVWSACRRLSENEQDAEDVFQAAFLVLARKAATIRNSAAVGSWLFGVAHRLALRARTDASRRRRHEEQVVRPAAPDQSDDLTLRELRSVLDEELARLPDKYRAPLLLCYFEELTQEEAAARLGWSKRLVKYRLERGRHQLRTRLVRRGLSLSVALTGSLFLSRAAAAVPAHLADTTLRWAIPFAVGQPVAAVLSARVLALTEGGLKIMVLPKLVVVAAGVLALAAVVGGTGLLLGRSAPVAGPPPSLPVQVAVAAKERVDLFGDPLPPGAVARLGTVRFRTGIHGWSLAGLGFMPDGRTVVSASGGNAVLFWEAATGKLSRELSTDIANIRGLALSSGGKYVAVGGFVGPGNNARQGGAVGVWDVATGKPVRIWKRASDDVGDRYSLALSPDNKHLVSFGGRSAVLRIEEIASGTEILSRQFPRDIGGTMTLSPDGSLLAVASGPNSRKLYVWKWQAGGEPRELKVRGYVGESLAFSSDGKRLAESDDIGKVIRVWDVAEGRLLHKLAPPATESHWPRSAVFSPDGKTLIASCFGNATGAVYLWDAATGDYRRPLSDWRGAEIGRGVAVSPDSRLLAVAGAGGLRVFDLTSGKELAATDAAHQSTIMQIAVAGNQVLTASDDHTIRIWDGTTAKMQRKLTHDHYVRTLAISPDGTRVASASVDDSVCVWDLATGRRIYKLPGHGRAGGGGVVSFTPDGKHLVSWGNDMYLRKWDLGTGKAVLEHRLQPTGVRVPAEDADDVQFERDFMVLLFSEAKFTPDGKMLVLTIGNDFHLFDVATGKDMRQIRGEGSHVVSVATSPDGKTLMASAWAKREANTSPDGRTQFSTVKDPSVCLWDLSTGKVRKQILLPDGEAGPVAFSPDGKLIATVTNKPGSRIGVWDLAKGTEIGAITSFRGRVHSLAFTADGKRLVSGMDDTTALVWDLPKKR